MIRSQFQREMPSFGELRRSLQIQYFLWTCKFRYRTTQHTFTRLSLAARQNKETYIHARIAWRDEAAVVTDGLTCAPTSFAFVDHNSLRSR